MGGKSWGSIEDWIGEKPEERYMVVEKRGDGQFEARLGSDLVGDDPPFEGARGERMRDAVYCLASKFLS